MFNYQKDFRNKNIQRKMISIITIEGLIAVKYLFKGDKAFQYFSIQGKKNIKKYLTDSRYIIYNKFEEKIKSFALSKDSNFIFIERRNEENKIVLEFKIRDVSQVIRPSNFYFIVSGFVPPFAGCCYCKYRKDYDDTFFYCEYKQKTLSNKIKNCRFFRQEETLFKT